MRLAEHHVAYRESSTVKVLEMLWCSGLLTWKLKTLLRDECSCHQFWWNEDQFMSQSLTLFVFVGVLFCNFTPRCDFE